MKKAISMFLALTLIVSLFAGCGSGSTTPTAANEVTTRTDSATANTTVAEEPAEEVTAWKAHDISGTIVIYSTQPQVWLDVIQDAFAEAYPDVTLEFISDSLGALHTRLESESGNPQADVVFGGLGQYDGAKHHKYYQQYTSAYVDESPLVDPDGYYNYWTYTAFNCFVVNTELLAETGVTVNSYADLLQPELKGKIIAGDPTVSSSAWRQLVSMLILFGGFEDDAAWDYVAKLIDNMDGITTTSSSTCYNSVYEGEYVVGVTYEDAVLSLINDGATNIEIVYPAEGNAASGTACAMVKDCPNQEGAAAVIDYLCSADFQDALAETTHATRQLNKTCTYENPDMVATDQLGIVDIDFADLLEKTDSIKEHYISLWNAANG